jgi:hypothetical protein
VSVPRRFLWRGAWYGVQRLLDLWTEAGAWWDGAQEATFLRVLTTDGNVCELILDHQGGWWLYRLYD